MLDSSDTALDAEIHVTPKENDFFVGHARAEQTLLSAWNSQKMPHGWLFCGPAGVGKATLAYRLARFVLSQSAEQDQAGAGLFGEEPLEVTSLALSKEHPTFQRLAAGGHGDFLSISPPEDLTATGQKKDIPVDEIRKIAPFLRLTSSEGGWRVVLIDQADQLNRSGQNAILKILEEPPEKTLLILIAQNAGVFLPTIISRVRKLSFSPLSEKDMTVAQQHYRPSLSPEDAYFVQALSSNSIGTALTLIDQDGVALYKEMLGLFETMPNLDRVKVSATLDKIIRDKSGQKWIVFTSLFEGWLKNLARAYACGRSPVALFPEEEAIFPVFMRQAQHPLLQRQDRWIEIWQQSNLLLQKCKRSSLDRKQAFSNILDLIAAAIAV